jgi:hypothetical protein
MNIGKLENVQGVIYGAFSSTFQKYRMNILELIEIDERD